MADNPTLDNGDLTDIKIASDDTAAGQVQKMKLAESTVDSSTPIPATAADGLLVNMGSNNDVTVTGTVTATLGAGTAAFGNLGAAVASTIIGSVVLSGSQSEIGTLGPSSTEIGHFKISDGTTQATVVDSGGTHDPLAVALIDSAGDALSFAKPVELTSTGPTVDTALYAANDSLDSTIISWASATVTAAGSGWITKVIIVDVDNEASDLELWFVNQSGVTPPTENTAFNPSDADAGKVTAIIDTSNGTWYSYANGSVCIVPVSPPMPFKLASGTTLYAMAKVLGTPTYTASTDLSIKLHILQD